MRVTLFVLLCVYSIFANAQYVEDYPANKGNGDQMISYKNWPEAVRIYSELMKKDPNDLEVKYKLGKSYVYSDIDKAKALAYLLDLLAFDKKEKDFYETLAQAYFMNYKFDEAKEVYKNMVDSVASNAKRAEYNKWIVQCDVSKKMYQSPVKVSFENLGKYINSTAPDFFPIVSPDESILLFTTRRKGVVGNLNSYAGYKTSDIFTSKHKRSRYTKARSVGSPNTYGNEFTAGRSSTGTFITYTVNSEDNFNDIFVSERGKRSYMPPKEFGGEEVNSKKDELGSTLTMDGRTMYFSSNREGGEGGFDLYYVQRLPNGGWSEIRNLGPSVNTPGDEMYPCFGKDDKVLYFASNGHKGMGGLDLFKSTAMAIPNGWNPPKNLGYPINTVGDDLNISFAENERYAYMAKRFDDSFGDLDIYRLTFHEEKDDYTLVTGRVLDQDSVEVTVKVKVEFLEDETGAFVGTYLKDSKGKYSAIVGPGRYSVEVKNVEGFKDFQKILVVFGKNDRVAMRSWDIVLERE